jgi:acetyl esterase/lipase
LTEEVFKQQAYWRSAATTKPEEMEACGDEDAADRARADEARRCRASVFYRTAAYQELRNRYRVSIASETLGGVGVEIFVPEGGVAPENAKRVLINLHGGGFRVGSRLISHLESIPIASVAKIKIISVDYRMAPQYHFPAASEDVAAVYSQLIKSYDPKNIGIFGCSAGGLLTAQSIAWFQRQNLPMPGAVGMFCAAASYWSEGDSGYFARLWEERPKSPREDKYFEYLKNVDMNDALAYPVRSKQIMARFPPSLLLSSTRDLALSSVAHTHSVLVELGVPAELHVWEGLPHAFIYNPRLLQSSEMYEITARFFDRYLGGVSPERLHSMEATRPQEVANRDR